MENTEWTENYCIHATECNFILRSNTNYWGGRCVMCECVCAKLACECCSLTKRSVEWGTNFIDVLYIANKKDYLN